MNDNRKPLSAALFNLIYRGERAAIKRNNVYYAFNGAEGDQVCRLTVSTLNNWLPEAQIKTIMLILEKVLMALGHEYKGLILEPFMRGGDGDRWFYHAFIWQRR